MMSQEMVWHVGPAKWSVKKKFVGTWRITQLQGYDAEYIDLCGPAKLSISGSGGCPMHFGAIEIILDCKTDDLDERVLRFSFEGQDEGDPICGRGYCLVEGNEMTGRLFRHLGDEFSFKAEKEKEAKKGKGKKRSRDSK